jgi:cell division septation protein DedD
LRQTHKELFHNLKGDVTMPNLNVKGESSRPSSAPLGGGGGGGASKTILILVVVIVALGGTVFVLNSTGIVKLWGKKKPQPAVVDIPAVEETFPAETQETVPVDTPAQQSEQQAPVEENLTKLESNVQISPGAVQNAAPKRMVVTGTGMYTVQISSWPTEEKAAVQAQLFTDAGFEAFVEPIGGWFRVCIGRYESRGDAKAQIEKMEHMLESMPIVAKVGH